MRRYLEMEESVLSEKLWHHELTSRILSSAIEVHRTLGPGLIESAYGSCLGFELRQAGLRFEREVQIDVEYKDLLVENAFRADFIVERTVIIEVKFVSAVEIIHAAQVMTYLRLTGLPVGLLMNFNVPVLRKGIRRFIHHRGRAESCSR